MVFGNTDLEREPRMMDEMAVLAVYRHEPFGFEEREQELELLLRGVPGYVYR